MSSILEAWDRRMAGIVKKDRTSAQQLLASEMWAANPGLHSDFIQCAYEYDVLIWEFDHDDQGIDITSAELFNVDVLDKVYEGTIEQMEQDAIGQVEDMAEAKQAQIDDGLTSRQQFLRGI